MPSYLNCAVKNGETVLVGRQENYNVMRDDTAYLLTSMMRECANSGTAKTLKIFQNVCAKTGTVGDKDGNSECYCVAYSPSYTVLCHISKKDKPLPLSYTGGTRPAKIVKKVFEFLHDVEEFTPPVSVIKCDIDLNEWKNGKVILANDFETEKNKKSCWFSKRYLPPKSNSYDVFFDKYLRDLNDLDRIYGFADKRIEIGNFRKL
jgi:membrane peptidoglycan carboxypeptidase